jgi:PAS domain S-box-containing protein
VASAVILNVDDTEAARYAKTRTLERGGYQVFEARTGSDALKLIPLEKPDLVLLDVRLPDISGYEVCAIIKRDYPQILVLQVSASFVQPGDRALGLDMGADSYLTQPIEPAELIATVRALLRLRKAEQAARASDELYRVIVESASDYAIITTDLYGVVQTWSDGAGAVLGYTAPEMIGQSLDRLFTPEDLAAGIPVDDRSRAAREGRVVDDRWLVGKNGERLWSNGVTVPLRAAGGGVTGFILIMRDRTAEKTHQDWLEREVRTRTRALVDSNDKLRREIEERERTEEALRQAQKVEALGQLTGGIAHDFNNMLTVVLGATESLKKRLPKEEEDQHRRADLVMQAGSQAAALTSRLLAFSRQQPRDPEPTAINALVGGLSSLVKSTLGENIEYISEIPPDLPAILIDDNQLENAILNLAVNARDAMSGGGRLTVRAGIAEGDTVTLTVADSGTGMPAEVVDRAFEPFFTTKRAGEGTGLGLAQVFRCVEQAGGSVRIDSAPGKGTAVEMRFPAVRKNVPAAVVAGATGQVTFSGAGRTALVVEDELGVREFVTESLRDLGFAVRSVGDAAAALDHLRRDKDIDLVVSDIGLPGGMDGWTLATQVRRLVPGLRMILMTGYAQSSAQPMGMATELLMKPFGRPALETRLARLFGS